MIFLISNQCNITVFIDNMNLNHSYYFSFILHVEDMHYAVISVIYITIGLFLFIVYIGESSIFQIEMSNILKGYIYGSSNCIPELKLDLRLDYGYCCVIRH